MGRTSGIGRHLAVSATLLRRAVTAAVLIQRR
jgi:hypothetical protein